MYGTAAEIYRTLDPAKKDATWINGAITIFRRDWVPLINQVRMRENKQYLDSMQSMEQIKDGFKDKAWKKNLNFDPVGIMEAFKNAMIEDILKSPPKAELKAVDPSAVSDRKKDIELLKNRKIVEDDINQYQQQVYGKMPKYRYGYENFKGNVEEFDKMGLKENDSEDLTFYEQEYQRLNYETSGQSVINNVLKMCRFDEDVAMKVSRDILAGKVITLQTYVDKITGELKIRYTYPETFYGIFGDSGDGRNDVCNGWEDNITINDFLQMVGDEFVWDRDWVKLLWAINFAGNTKYTGFIRNNTRYDCSINSEWVKEGNLEGVKSNLIEWTMVFNYQINCGYIEFKTMEATSTAVIHDSKPGYAFEIIPYHQELSEKQVLDGYRKESSYQQQMYGSYFITTTSVSQWIFGAGKVYYQKLEGANDEYAVGTMRYYLLPGKAAVEIARPYITLVNKAFYKMLWCVDKSKPEEDVYIYEELIQIAKGLQRLYPQSATNSAPKLDTILKDAIKYQQENVVRIRAYPQVEGRSVLQLPPLEGKRNGLDPVAVAMQAVVNWGEQQVASKIGFNPMRSGMNPPSRESEKTEMNTVEYSINATSYIYRMIQYIKEKVATDVLTITQDIIKFKDSMPYNWLKRLIGTETFDGLLLLDEYAAHRYGIFVRDYNVAIEKQRINQAADMALTQKEIQLDQWFMVTQTEDYKKAIKLLSLYKRKELKKQRMQALQDMKIAQEMEVQKHKNLMEQINTKGQWDLQKAREEKEGFIQAAKIQADSRVQVKEITVDAETPKQAAKAEATKDINTSKEKDQETRPFPAAAGGQ